MRIVYMTKLVKVRASERKYLAYDQDNSTFLIINCGSQVILMQVICHIS